MGYTHSYRILDSDSPEWKAAWPQLVKDTQRIIDAAGVTVSGPTEDEEIVTPPIVDEKDGIYICGAGEEAYEPFILVPKDQNRGVNGLQYCKTGRRGYDDVVTCILLRVKMLAPNSFYLSSDGYWDEWKPAREIYQKIWPDASIECPFNDNEDEIEENSEDEKQSIGSGEGRSDKEHDNSYTAKNLGIQEILIDSQDNSRGPVLRLDVSCKSIRFADSDPQLKRFSVASRPE